MALLNIAMPVRHIITLVELVVLTTHKRVPAQEMDNIEVINN